MLTASKRMQRLRYKVEISTKLIFSIVTQSLADFDEKMNRRNHTRFLESEANLQQAVMDCFHSAVDHTLFWKNQKVYPR